MNISAVLVYITLNLASLGACMFYLLFKYEPATFKQNWWLLLAVLMRFAIQAGEIGFIMIGCFALRLLYCRFWRQEKKAPPTEDGAAIIERVKADAIHYTQTF